MFATRQDLRIIDLFAKGTMGGQVLKYPVYGKLEGKPGETDEGAAAAHTHFPRPPLGRAIPSTPSRICGSSPMT